MERFTEFTIEHRGDKWVVVGHQGRTVGTHNSKEEAKKQIAAIYASGYRKKENLPYDMSHPFPGKEKVAVDSFSNMNRGILDTDTEEEQFFESTFSYDQKEKSRESDFPGKTEGHTLTGESTNLEGIDESVFSKKDKPIKDPQYKGDFSTKREYLNQFQDAFLFAMSYFHFWTDSEEWKYRDFVIKSFKAQVPGSSINPTSLFSFEVYYNKKLIARLTAQATMNKEESEYEYNNRGVSPFSIADIDFAQKDLTDPKGKNYVRPGSEFLVKEAFRQLEIESNAEELLNSGEDLTENFKESAKVDKLKHLTHLEDLVIEDGEEGANYAFNILASLSSMLNGETPSTDIKITRKVDGAPAVIAGVNPDNGQFFVATKSAFNANPKLNYTVEDIQANHTKSIELQEKLEYALKYLPEVIPEGIYQGDFLYIDSDLIEQHDPQDSSKTLVTFQPNTIMYAVETNSDLGHQILASKMGICIHTKYEGDTLADQHATFNFDFGLVQSSVNVLVVPPTVPSLAGLVTLTEEERERIDDILIQLPELIGEVDPSIFEILTSDPIAPIVYQKYENDKIRKGSVSFDARELIAHIKAYIEKEIASKKSEKGKASTKEKLLKLQELSERMPDLEKVVLWQRLVYEAKIIFIKKLNNVSKVFSKYLVYNNGNIELTGEEGFAVSSIEGGITKIVDRLQFSKANFSSEVKKGWQHPED